MPAGRSVKRNAATPAAADSKRAKHDPLMIGVLDALRQADDLPEDCRSMLAAVAPGSLGTPAAERHESQALLVSYIGEVVEGLRSKLQAALDTADMEQATADSKRAVLDGKVLEAKAALSTENEEVEEKHAAMDKAAQAVASAQARVQEAQEALGSGDTKLQEVTKDKQFLETALQRDVGYLMQEDGFEAMQAGHYVDTLLPVAKRIGLDDSFLAAMPSSCGKPPSGRGSFDGMVLAQLQASLQEKVAQVAAEFKASSESRAALAGSATAAQDDLGAAEDCRSAAAEAVEAAKSRQERAVEAVHEAEAAVDAFVREGSARVANRAEKVDALTNFTNYNVECFKVLRDKAACAGA